MRLALHTAICCYLIAAVLPVPVEDTAGHASLKKRIKAWLQNHMKMDTDVGERQLETAGAQQEENEETTSPPSSLELKVRQRRAASLKASGCVLFMCAYHDLLFRLHHISNKHKVKNAPENKIRSGGYGRRRRRSPEDGVATDTPEAPHLCRSNVCVTRRNRGVSLQQLLRDLRDGTDLRWRDKMAAATPQTEGGKDVAGDFTAIQTAMSTTPWSLKQM